MNNNSRFSAFCRLGKILHSLNQTDNQILGFEFTSKELLAEENLKFEMQKSIAANPWFTENSVKKAIAGIAEMLEESSMNAWKEYYKFPVESIPKKVAVIMAGNIPAVGFHDFACVLLSGHKIIVKLSSNDQFLLPAIANVLVAIDPEFLQLFEFSSGKLSGFDAVIATGSGNSLRYFEFYFGKYPHIIRSNRNSIAILKGDETIEELELLANDVFTYFGLGCRNVTHIFVPSNYNFHQMLEVFANKTELMYHSKYFNNYEYNKALFLINSVKHFDNGTLLLTEESAINSPVSVLNYSYYDDIEELKKYLELEKDKIQCVVAKNEIMKGSVEFGQSQSPSVADYADGTDTMDFLLGLNNL